MNTKFDIYLSRATGLVQIGLFIVTLLTLYFTVIPLYKNAQLEEVIAKKELELASLNRALSDLYVRVRLTDAGNLAEQAVECSGWRQLVLGETKSGDSLSKNIVGCIDSAVGSYDFSRFKEVDRLLLKDRVGDVKLLVSSAQSKYRAKYIGYPEEIKSNPSMIIPSEPDDLSEDLESLMVGLGVFVPVSPEEDFNRKVVQGRSRIERQYFREVVELIRGIPNVKWAEL